MLRLSILSAILLLSPASSQPGGDNLTTPTPPTTSAPITTPTPPTTSAPITNPPFIRTCNCSGYFTPQEQPTDTLKWLNTFLSSIYFINSDKIFVILRDAIQEQASKHLPAGISSVTLTKFNMTNTPEIDLGRSRLNKVNCNDVQLGRNVLDLDLRFENPGKVADMVVNGMFTVGVSNAVISGIVRVEVLLSSQDGFNGLENVRIYFLERPDVQFDVWMLPLAGLVADALDKLLVYPSMIFLDLSPLARREDMVTLQVEKDPDLNLAVMSASVKITPLNNTNNGLNVTGLFEFGKRKVKESVLTNGEPFQFDMFVKNSDRSGIRVRIIEQYEAASDVVWAELNVRLIDLLTSGSEKQSVSKIHQDGDMSWRVTLDLWSSPLQPVHMVGDKLLPSLFSQTQCTHPGEYGVLYLNIHRVSDFSSPPNITVLLDGKEIMKTGPVPDSEIDKKVEILMQNDGKQLSDHVVEFQASGGVTGNVSIVPNKEMVLNEELVVSGEGEKRGLIYVSVIFRPVPSM